MPPLVSHPFRRLLALSTALSLTLCACAPKPVATPVDVLTQKRTEPGRTPITVLVKYAFSINAFEAAVEEKFPDIDLVQVGNYTTNLGQDEYERRLKNDDLPDMVMTWPLDVGEPYWEDRLLDLSGFDFTSRYNLSMLDTISRGGKLYYLPGPSQVRGIVYNKTLFAERGWQVPKNFEEFIALCQTIEASGMRSIQLGFKNPEVLDTAFIGYSHASSYSKPQDIQWLADYNQGKGSFGEHFGGSLDTFLALRDAGIWQPQDLQVDYSRRETMFFSRQCAMVEDSVLMARLGGERTGTTDEFALMPFFNEGTTDSDWARLYMVCYIGLSSHLAEPGNEDKYQQVLNLMDYISSPEGQEALAADTGAMFSSLMGASPADVPEIADLAPALTHGRYAVFPQLKNAQNALRKGLAGMLDGSLTKEEVIQMVDAENANPPRPAPPKELGTATETFTLIETGSFLTDAMARWSGCEIALFLDNGKDGRYNNKGLSGKIYQGPITQTDVTCILPDLKSEDTGVLSRVTMTGENLRKTLEYSLPIENEKMGWFYYFSGLRMTYDPTAEPGSRIKTITLADGAPLEDSALYTVAVMEGTVPADYLTTSEPTQQTITAILTEAIETAGTISPSGDGRFTLVP